VQHFKIVHQTNQYTMKIILKAAYWDNERCRTVSSGRIKVRVVRQKEGQYMFNICNITVGESGMDRN